MTLRPSPRSSGAAIRLLVAAVASVAGMACSIDTSLERLTEARRLSADLLLQFTKAGDAANRAVMADTGATAAAFVTEAEQMSQAVQQSADALAPLLKDLRYADESRLLEEFRGRFAEYRALDQRILQLAVEATNMKAQRLSFGAGREAADALDEALAGVAPRDAAADLWRVKALTAEVMMRVHRIEALQAPHIAEPDDAVMNGLEAKMAAAEAAARTALKTLGPLIEAGSQPRLAVATAAFERFIALNAEIVVLSRRNTNVKSLALSLNQKRVITAACDDSLQALAGALAKRGFAATR